MHSKKKFKKNKLIVQIGLNFNHLISMNYLIMNLLFQITKIILIHMIVLILD